jgi:signal transduction histidine kinase
MIAEAIGKLIPALLCIAIWSNKANTQTWQLSPNISRVITGQCPVCALPNNNAPKFHPVPASVANDFHACHTHLEQNDLDRGYEYAVRCEHSLNSKDHPLFISALFLKARVLYLKQSYREALQDYLVLIQKPQTNPLLFSNIYTNTAEVYLNLGEYDNALKYFTAWKEKFISLADSGNLATWYSNMGTCLFHLKRFSEADLHFGHAEDISNLLRDTLGLAILYTNIGSLYYANYLDRQAGVYFKKALHISQRSGDTGTLQSAYWNMAVIRAGSKQYREAYDYMLKSDELKDSIWNRDRVWILANEEKKIIAEQQELKDALVREAARSKDLQIKNEQLNNKILAALAFVFLFIIALVYVAYRQTSRRNRIIARQKNELGQLNDTKDQLFSILAHDLRSPVHSLRVHLSSLKSALGQNHIQEATRLSENIEKISNSTYGLLDNLLHWSLSQTGQLNFLAERLQLKQVVDQVLYDYVPLAASRHISLESRVPPQLFFSADMNSVKIILRNLVDNAIKFTPAGGSIVVSANPAGNECELAVQDSGTGMDQQTIMALQDGRRKRIQKDAGGNRSTGLGLWLSKSMAEKNGGHLCINSIEGKGTTVTVSLPLTP